MPLITKQVLVNWTIEGVLFLLGVLLSAWLSGRTLRKKNLPPMSLLRRLGYSFFAGGSILWACVLCVFVMENKIAGIIGFVTIVGAIAFFVWTPKVSLRGLHLGGILLCNAIAIAGIRSGLQNYPAACVGTMDAASLHAISRGLQEYRSEYKAFPGDLGLLVDTNHVSPKCLYFAWTEKRPQSRQASESQPYKGGSDFEYIKLPDDAPEGLVWAWGAPKYFKGEGAYLLYSWGEVKWVTAEELERALNRTRQWLAGRAAQTKPAFMPHPA